MLSLFWGHYSARFLAGASAVIVCLLVLSGCEYGTYDVVQIPRGHVVGCTPGKINKWPGDIWVVSSDTAPRGDRYRWLDPEDQPLCQVWNRHTYWDISLRAYERIDPDNKQQYTAYNVMSMRPTP